MEFSKRQKAELKQFAGKFGLDLVFFFGSAAKGKEVSESDIDFGVLKRGHRLTFEEMMKLYRHFSLLFGDNVDIADLASAGPLLRFEVAKTGKVLFRRNKTAREEFVLHACRDYYDFEPYFRLEEKAIKKSILHFHKQYA